MLLSIRGLVIFILYGFLAYFKGILSIFPRLQTTRQKNNTVIFHKTTNFNLYKSVGGGGGIQNIFKIFQFILWNSLREHNNIFIDKAGCLEHPV